ncbi:venom carboxylesterase-6-like [Schistocerca piceifrons]|uniref:venom carboxylesterase-6-like n=1 Tax=Schistocerca piceifrons TaxID=274613 RepID=UPI001F5FC1BE|nr:venom carboxylesterase-6-like [Schistocerca piceifrons]
MRSAVLLLVGALWVGLSDSAPRTQLQQGEDVFVTVETGALRGVVSTSLNGTLYSKFVGIPFATPPLGDLHFRKGRGSEYCLYVNLYVPLVNDSSPLAVMVNIHGGGYTTGSSRFRRPDFFMDKGVLVVTFNYRLGSIVFLSLQNDDIPGNAGLKDQVFALQWVQRNIDAFGGDPDKVTIFGESAGGSSTSHLFLSPATKGLFRRAIMESGVANGNWSVEQTPREKAYRLAAALGFQTQGDNDSAVVAFLRAADHTDLTRDNSQALSDFEKRGRKGIAFSPVIEPQSDTAVVTGSPGDILRQGRYNQVAVMTGVTSADGSVIVEWMRHFTGNAHVVAASGMQTDEAYAADIESFTLLVGSQLPLPTVEQQTEAAVKVEDFYFGEEGFSVDNTQAVYDMHQANKVINLSTRASRYVIQVVGNRLVAETWGSISATFCA